MIKNKTDNKKSTDKKIEAKKTTTNTATTTTASASTSLGNAKIAVVDVQALVNQTPSVIALRAEQQNNMAIIQNWVAGVNNQLSQIADQNQRASLTQQYQIELNKREQILQSQYAQKVQAIDAELSKLVSDVANEKKLDYVFAKGMVVFGGTDITADVAKRLKK
jgi:outer membrane protein